MNDIDRAVENQSLYQCIQEKAKKILDLSNPFEEQMYYDLMNMAKIRCCTPYVSPEEYDRMVRFTESAIANDKWDILSKFWELDNQILSRHDMEKNWTDIFPFLMHLLHGSLKAPDESWLRNVRRGASEWL